MNKTIINVIPHPKGGGAELLVRELHRGLLSSGADSYVIYFNSDGVELEDREFSLGVNARSPLNILALRKCILKIQREKKSRLIIHSHLTWPFFYVAIATLFIKCTLFYTEHNTVNSRRHLPFFWIVERVFYARYKKIFCITEGVKKSLLSWLKKQDESHSLEVVLNGGRLYQTCIRESLNGRKARLVSVGSLSAKKNFETSVRAIALLRQHVSSYTIIGEGPERRNLERIISDYKLEDVVRLVGWSDNIEFYLREADVQLIPSLWEGFGLVAVEGMSTGLSIVASNVDGLREVVDPQNPAVNLVDEILSPDVWALAIKRTVQKLMADNDGVLSISARKQAEKYTMQAMVDRYRAFYESS